MKKKLPNHLWESYIELLREPSTLSGYITYYKSIVDWIKKNNKYISEDLLNRWYLDVLMKIDPYKYVVDNPDFRLSSELYSFEMNKPSSLDNLLMRISGRLLEMCTIRSGKECPNCNGDELHYLLINTFSNEEKIILECKRCAWTENLDGVKWEEKVLNYIPANKRDLARFGI